MEVYRFYCPDLHAGSIELPEDQAHHALHVLRLTAGTPVELFDGRGGVAAARLTTPAKRTVAALADELRHDPAPWLRLTIASAVPKADRAEWLVDQASQLNVTALQWLDCQRSVVKPREGGGKMEKFARLAIESAKQCGRNHVLELRDMVRVAEALKQTDAAQVWLLDPRAEASVADAVGELSIQPPSPVPAASAGAASSAADSGILALVGPEGGWSPEELAACAAHPRIRTLRLAPTILRIETACCAIAALCAAAAPAG
jgi:16S rRNA (uracil1498-N3)-methyltransferase